LLFQSGPLAPLSLLVLGLVMFFTKVVDWKIAMLITLGAILFPLSRISRVDLISHIADVVQLIPMAVLGVELMKNRKVSG